MTVEGANDDISGVGQTQAAHGLVTPKLPDESLREIYVHPDRRPLRRVQRPPLRRGYLPAGARLHQSTRISLPGGVSLFQPKHRDGDRLQLGTVPVRLRVNPRAKRLLLRIDRRAHEAVIVAPTERQLGRAVAFARERMDWLSRQMAKVETAPTHPVMAPGERRLAMARAELVLRDRVRVHCASLGVTPPRVRLNDPRTRWGSCTKAHGDKPSSVRLSWRLILAPPAVYDYVVAHECAHILEANHGPRFWAVVERLVGDPRPHRRLAAQARRVAPRALTPQNGGESSRPGGESASGAGCSSVEAGGA